MSLASLEGPLGVADVSFLTTLLRGLGVLETTASSTHIHMITTTWVYSISIRVKRTCM